MDSGIYTIENRVNGKFYIGSTNTLRRRRSGHFSLLKKNKHDNMHLQASYNKYGKESFTFRVIKYVEEDLLAVEQAYLDVYWDGGICCYNIAKSSTAPSLGYKHSQETIDRVSKVHKGNTYRLGSKLSVENKEALRKSLLGNKFRSGIKQTPEHIAKRVLASHAKIKEARNKPEAKAALKKRMLGNTLCLGIKRPRIYCKQGHLLSETGIPNGKTGHRICKSCKYKRDSERRLKTKMNNG